MEHGFQIALSRFSGATKLFHLSPPVTRPGSAQTFNLVFVIDLPTALTFSIHFISKDLK